MRQASHPYSLPVWRIRGLDSAQLQPNTHVETDLYAPCQNTSFGFFFFGFDYRMLSKPQNIVTGRSQPHMIMTLMEDCLQQTQNQWTKKINRIFRICGIVNTIILLILDPGRRTESITTFPTPLILWLPVSLIGLIILEAPRQLILHHVTERLLDAYAALVYHIRSRSRSRSQIENEIYPIRLEYPFPYRFLWDILCAQFVLVFAIELILILNYQHSTRLIKFDISVVFVFLLLLMVYLIFEGSRRIQRELGAKAVWSSLGLDSQVSIDEYGEDSRGK
uniref:Uncharacterized protein n=1 Tax=Moniliophthora roreri TaxID=221103 RepID=A0A0W0F304_MONRR